METLADAAKSDFGLANHSKDVEMNAAELLSRFQFRGQKKQPLEDSLNRTSVH